MDDEQDDKGAHSALINDQIKWSRHPIDGRYGFYVNFEHFITQEELLKVFEEKFGTCRNWRIPKR